jgi:hypothetical protein
MKVQKIEILSDLSYDLKDIEDYNSDVLVELENGQDYIVVVATPKNLLSLMNNEKSDFLSPGDPMIVVKQFTKEIIEKTIQAYAADDAYWLKFYASDINVKILDAIKIDKGEEAILENLKLSDFE